MNKNIYINYDKCTGCRSCELVCSIKNEGLVNPVLARIQPIAFKYEGLRVPTICMQCETPSCAIVCPTRALQKDKETGVIKHNKDYCIGCRQCFMACPFGGISVNPATGKVFKCELCEGDPECVKACYDDAILFEEPDVALVNKKTKSAKKQIQVVEANHDHS
jgi:anaerobic carbon-monoxide dehydrogenase iron sulfur subunit